MILTFWYLMMFALAWSVFYRSAIADGRTWFCIRLGLFGTAVGSVVGMTAPLFGWVPDFVTTVIVLSIVNMQVAFAKFWARGVPQQYIKPQYRVAHRRVTDLDHA